MREAVYFFADKDDLKSMLVDFEERAAVTYIEAGVHEIKDVTVHQSLLDLPGLGTVTHGERYAVDQKINSASMVIKPPGLFARTYWLADLLEQSQPTPSRLKRSTPLENP